MDAKLRTRQGVGWMLLAVFFFALMDAIAKRLTEDYPPPQVTWARFVFHLSWLLIFLGRRSFSAVRTRCLALQLLRGVLMLGANVCFIIAISIVSLLTANSVLMLNPLLATALSVPFLGERVGWRRWVCVGAGCAGALIIIRPTSDVFHWASLLPLVAAAVFSIYQIVTRKIGQRDPPLTSLLYTVLVGAPVMSAVMPWIWVAPDTLGWTLMATMGLIGGLGHFALIKAFAIAPVSVVTPFIYSSLFWAALLGFLLFSELPDLWTIVGAVIIIVSGWYAFVSEQDFRAHRG